MPESRQLFEEFDSLQTRFGPYWPARQAHQPDERCEPQVMLELAMNRLRMWCSDGADLIEQVESLKRQREDLLLLQEIFRETEDPLPNVQELNEAGPMLKTCLYLLASDDWPSTVNNSVIVQRLTTSDHFLLLAIGLRHDIDTLEQQLQLQKARPLRLPDGLPNTAREAEILICERLVATKAHIDSVHREIAALHEWHDLADALADADFVRWYFENVPDLASTENFAWITGWTSMSDEESLVRLLAAEDIKGLLRLSEPPSGFDVPLLMNNPQWMRPFELFTVMLGVPSAVEADPTRIVAVASPLMFGYMFGDVGHGAVLLLLGLILSARFPALRILTAGGIASIVFGFLFGSVFGMENIISPLWIKPMAHPILILLVPVAGGAVLLLIGMSLDALQAYWNRQGQYWWETGAGLMLCYLALLGSLLEPRLLWVAMLGAIWFIFGHALAARDKQLAAMGSAAGEFMESVLQLVVNTISFVRVGAFALAHAGLSQAVIGIAETLTSLTAKLLMLVFGNALIIGLEGLVVSIQTTRLLLFEFFIRFLRAEGRPFKPIVLPSSISPNDQRRQQ